MSVSIPDKLGPRWMPGWLTGRRATKPQCMRRSIRLTLERLEDRLTPTTHTYNPVDAAGLISALQSAEDGSPGDLTVINLSKGADYELTQVNNYWYGPNGLPPIKSQVVINGNGARIERTTAPSIPDFRLFYVSGGMEFSQGTLSLGNVTLQGGIAKGGDSEFGGGGLGAGGAIFNQGQTFLIDVTLVNNAAEGGDSGVGATGSFAGGGMGGNASGGNGGGFGGSLGTNWAAGSGGTGEANLGGGGGGFVSFQNGTAGAFGGSGGGYGGLGSGGTGDSASDGGYGGGNVTGLTGTPGDGGAFGQGGFAGDGAGGGGIGGGGGGPGTNFKLDSIGAGGGFGGGGGAGVGVGGAGGFGAGGGADEQSGDIPSNGGSGGFGGGTGAIFSGNFGGGGGGAGLGGAIFNMGADSDNSNSGELALGNCTLAGNYAYGGDSTIAAPFAPGTPGAGNGGAIFNLDGDVTLDSDTLVGNHAYGGSNNNGLDGGGGGDAVYNLSFGHDIPTITGSPVAATLVLDNNILASTPSASVLATAGSTATVSGSHNLVMSHAGTVGAGVITLTADPNLNPLQYNNGSLMQTLLPSPGSPVLGAGDPNSIQGILLIDQNGVPRPPNGPIDLGSVQVSVAPTAGGGSTGNKLISGASSPASPTLQVPPLLAFLDSILEGVETVNSDGTETVTDSLFGIPLLVSTFDSAGKLVSVTLFGFNVTFLFG